jgi:F-box and WD-40 domain protein CDC4
LEITLLIFNYLDLKSLLNACRVNRSWYSLIQNDSFVWKKFLLDLGIDNVKDNRPLTLRKSIEKHFRTLENWRTGTCKSFTFIGHPSSVVTCMQFDEEKIVSGSDDYSVQIWSTKTGTLLKR